MRSNLVEFGFALIGQANASLPRNMGPICGLLGGEFRVHGNQLDGMAAVAVHVEVSAQDGYLGNVHVTILISVDIFT